MSISNEDILAAAAELGMVRATPRRGRQPAARCGRGHDLKKFGKQQWKTKPDGTKVKNGFVCLECKREHARKPGGIPRPNAQKPRRPKDQQDTREGRRRKT